MLVSFLLSAAFFAPAGFAASAPRAVEVEEKVVEPELEDAASVGESEDAREMLRKNMQDLAQSHLDHAILEAQLEKLAEVYDSRGNDQRVREVLDLQERERTQFAARRQFFMAVLPPAAMAHVESALLSGASGMSQKAGSSAPTRVSKAASRQGGKRAVNATAKKASARPKQASAGKKPSPGTEPMAGKKPSAGNQAKASRGAAASRSGSRGGGAAKVASAKGKGRSGGKVAKTGTGKPKGAAKAAKKSGGKRAAGPARKGGAKTARAGATRSGGSAQGSKSAPSEGNARIRSILTQAGRGSLLLGTERLDVWER
jgi:hypothetical protein